jgi:hypothetical protein
VTVINYVHALFPLLQMSIKLNLLRMTLKSRVITIFAVQSPPSNAEVKE